MKKLKALSAVTVMLTLSVLFTTPISADEAELIDDIAVTQINENDKVNIDEEENEDEVSSYNSTFIGGYISLEAFLQIKTPEEQKSLNIKEIEADKEYTNITTEANEPHCFLIDTTDIKKLTAMIEFDETTYFSTFIYKCVGDGSYELVDTSPYNGSNDRKEQIAFLPEGGKYLIAVQASNAGTFKFKTVKSDTCSSYEANDNIHQAKCVNEELSLLESFDNEHDVDWNIINIKYADIFDIKTLTNNAVIENAYLINYDTSFVYNITETFESVYLEPGKYYLMTSGHGLSVENSYSIDIKHQSINISKVVIDTQNNCYDIFEHGKKLVFGLSDKFKNITGTAYDIEGNIAVNCVLKISIENSKGEIFEYVTKTDANGRFSIPLNIKAAQENGSIFTLNGLKYNYTVLNMHFTNFDGYKIESSENSIYYVLGILPIYC